VGHTPRNLSPTRRPDIAKVDGIIISGVVPSIDSTLAFMTKRYFHTEVFASPAHRYRAHYPLRQPSEVGADLVSRSPASTNTAARA
jgi:pantothenate kinase type III